MAPRPPPKTYQIPIKTHKLTVFAQLPQASTIGALKSAALSALQASVLAATEQERRLVEVLMSPPRFDPADDDDVDDLGLDGDEPEAAAGAGKEGGAAERIPPVDTVEDFELCRGVKEKTAGPATSTAWQHVLPARYEPLDPALPIKGTLANWEAVYVQFRDRRTGALNPVSVTLPPLHDEDEETERRDRMYGGVPPTPELVPSSRLPPESAKPRRMSKRSHEEPTSRLDLL